jgi:hypothetical protein
VPDVSEYRLPSWQKPSLYDLALVPDFVAFTFQGHVRITLELSKAASSVLLNSAELTYPTAKGADGQERPQVSIRPLAAPTAEEAGPSIPCVGVTLDAKAARASFDFGCELTPGRCERSSILFHGGMMRVGQGKGWGREGGGGQILCFSPAPVC